MPFLQIPAGWLVDRYGVKFPYAIGFLFWSLVSAATALAGSLRQLLAAADAAGRRRIHRDAGQHALDPLPLRRKSSAGWRWGMYMTGTKIGPAIGAPWPPG